MVDPVLLMYSALALTALTTTAVAVWRAINYMESEEAGNGNKSADPASERVGAAVTVVEVSPDRLDALLKGATMLREVRSDSFAARVERKVGNESPHEVPVPSSESQAVLPVPTTCRQTTVSPQASAARLAVLHAGMGAFSAYAVERSQQ